MCNDTTTVMIQLYHVYSKIITSTGIATAIFHHYDTKEEQIKYLNPHNYALYSKTKDHITIHTILFLSLK